MRKHLLIGMAAIASWFATSCSEELEQVNSGNTSTVSIKVETPEIQSRADYSDGSTATVLQYAVYDAAGKELTDLTVTNGEIHGSATVNLTLTTGNTYSVIFWAAAENAPYTVEFGKNLDEAKMKVNYDGAKSNDESRDAFYCVLPIEVTGSKIVTAELKRPFAQLNIGTADYEYSTKAGYTPEYSYVKVPVSSVLNFAAGSVDAAKEVEFKYAEIDKEQDFPVEGNYEYLAMNYLLVGAEQETVDLTFGYAESVDEEGKPVNAKTRKVGSVPVARNHRTNIYGNLLTSQVDINVEIKPEYEKDAYNNKHDYYVEEGIYYIRTANGLRYFAEQVNQVNPEWMNATVVLANDIDLAAEARSTTVNWTPIGLSKDLANGKTFRGTFDGKGYTIKNMVCEGTDVAGLFGYLYAATIKNVTIEDATINSDHFAGGIVAWVLNNKGNIKVPMVIENCHVKNSTIISDPLVLDNKGEYNGDKVGGIVGYACFGDDSGYNEGAKIANCSVEGTTIKAYRDFGGLVGYAKFATIENCSVSDITLEQDLTNNYKAPNTPSTFSTTIGNNAGNNTVNGKAYITDGVTEKDENYYIYNAAGLKWVANEVNKYSNYEYPFKDKVIYLTQDIDLGGMEWTPIGDYRFSANRFCGTFDGQGHTISNFQITKKTGKDDSNKSSYGFFGNVEGTIKNLTVANATVNSYAYTGALAGRLNSGLIENCHVVNSKVSNTYWQGGILIGQVNGEEKKSVVRNCSVKNSSITSKSAIGAIAGPITVTKEGSATFESCVVENCSVIQEGSFGGSYDKHFGTMFGYLDADATSRINVNNCTAINTTVKGESNAMFAGDIDGNIYVNGGLAVATAEVLEAALQAGGDYALVSDIYLSEPIYIENKTFSLNGNGYKIGQSSEYPAEGTTTTALIHPKGCTATMENIVFDGLNVDGPIRTVNTKLTINNVIVKNCVREVKGSTAQGLFRLHGESNITNCTFTDNTCPMAISLNWDGNNNLPQAVKNCVFKKNNCISTAVVYYVKGSKCEVVGNEFIENTVTVTGGSNAATLYMGFTENNVITSNLFQNNIVNAGTSKRVAGGVMLGYNSVFTDNAFIGNKVNATTEVKGNNVCASVYYTDIDLSGNYWGGNAPVENDDCFVEYPDRHLVIINDYLTTWGN